MTPLLLEARIEEGIGKVSCQQGRNSYDICHCHDSHTKNNNALHGALRKLKYKFKFDN
jgi:hypothetical protein